MTAIGRAIQDRQHVRRHERKLRAVDNFPRAEPQGPLRLGTSYNFVEKSPVVDELRTIMGGDTYNRVAELTGLHAQTIKNLFSGKTRNPRAATLELFARAYGKRVGLVDP